MCQKRHLIKGLCLLGVGGCKIGLRTTKLAIAVIFTSLAVCNVINACWGCVSECIKYVEKVVEWPAEEKIPAIATWFGSAMDIESPVQRYWFNDPTSSTSIGFAAGGCSAGIASIYQRTYDYVESMQSLYNHVPEKLYFNPYIDIHRIPCAANTVFIKIGNFWKDQILSNEAQFLVLTPNSVNYSAEIFFFATGGTGGKSQSGSTYIKNQIIKLESFSPESTDTNFRILPIELKPYTKKMFEFSKKNTGTYPGFELFLKLIFEQQNPVNKPFNLIIYRNFPLNNYDKKYDEKYKLTVESFKNFSPLLYEFLTQDIDNTVSGLKGQLTEYYQQKDSTNFDDLLSLISFFNLSEFVPELMDLLNKIQDRNRQNKILEAFQKISSSNLVKTFNNTYLNSKFHHWEFLYLMNHKPEMYVKEYYKNYFIKPYTIVDWIIYNKCKTDPEFLKTVLSCYHYSFSIAKRATAVFMISQCHKKNAVDILNSEIFLLNILAITFNTLEDIFTNVMYFFHQNPSYLLFVRSVTYNAKRYSKILQLQKDRILKF